jgi:hypothetical protein
MDISNEVREMLEMSFPSLPDQDYSPQSEATTDYNCIAFAAGDLKRWWWPRPGYYWPPGVPREETLDALIAAFGSVGYTEKCDVSDLYPGYEGIAVFILSGKPKHAARQYADGRWASKLGSCLDLTHPLHALEGADYGRVAAVLRRKVFRA